MHNGDRDERRGTANGRNITTQVRTKNDRPPKRRVLRCIQTPRILASIAASGMLSVTELKPAALASMSALPVVCPNPMIP